MSRPRHALKGAVHRHPYALVLTAEHGWVRFSYFGPGEHLVVDLDGTVVESAGPESLSARLVRSVVEELREGDPVVSIEVGGTAVRVEWGAG